MFGRITCWKIKPTWSIMVKRCCMTCLRKFVIKNTSCFLIVPQLSVRLKYQTFHNTTSTLSPLLISKTEISLVVAFMVQSSKLLELKYLVLEKSGAEMDVTLREAYKNKDHPLVYPEHLDHLLDKDFAFRAKYQPYYRQAFVVRLTQDCKVMWQIEEVITHAQACLTITNKDESPKGKVVLFLEDNNVVNTQTNVTHSKTTTYATQNWSPEASISITPSKWLSPDSVQDLEGPDLLSPKLSATNAAKTKSGRNTKIK